jgi:hypothetical protein
MEEVRYEQRFIDISRASGPICARKCISPEIAMRAATAPIKSEIQVSHDTSTSQPQRRDDGYRRRRSRGPAQDPRRRNLVIGLRIAILVIVLGGWEGCARSAGSIPSSFPAFADRGQIVEWMVEGTSQGSLWTQVLVTLEETVLGFLIGSVAGVIAGIVLGATSCSRMSSASTSRSPTRSRAWCWAPSSSSPSAWAWPPRWRWRW